MYRSTILGLGMQPPRKTLLQRRAQETDKAVAGTVGAPIDVALRRMDTAQAIPSESELMPGSPVARRKRMRDELMGRQKPTRGANPFTRGVLTTG